MDAVSGYFQIALDKESSMKTTFLLPSGRYRYLRIPQGLNASSDEWCRRSNTVIDGLPWAKKIVDDILVWASSLPELKIRVETIAHNCQNLNTTLSKKKFEIGKQIQFAGYLGSRGKTRPGQNTSHHRLPKTNKSDRSQIIPRVSPATVILYS